MLSYETIEINLFVARKYTCFSFSVDDSIYDSKGALKVIPRHKHIQFAYLDVLTDVIPGPAGMYNILMFL